MCVLALVAGWLTRLVLQPNKPVLRKKPNRPTMRVKDVLTGCDITVEVDDGESSEEASHEPCRFCGRYSCSSFLDTQHYLSCFRMIEIEGMLRHERVCPAREKPIKCPRGCGKLVFVDEIEAHQAVCRQYHPVDPR